jgi:hypothetical protein
VTLFLRINVGAEVTDHVPDQLSRSFRLTGYIDVFFVPLHEIALNLFSKLSRTIPRKYFQHPSQESVIPGLFHLDAFDYEEPVNTLKLKH